MGNNLREETMIPDLNQEPLDRPRNSNIGLGSTTNESETERSLKNPAELIALALETEPLRSVETRQDNKCGDGGDFFDCNVCLSLATEPILTCCGHLFCWPCFYNLPYEYLDVKECPVCGGDVAYKSLIPIYGNSDAKPTFKRKISGLEVPPRPNAKRVEVSSPRPGNRSGVSNVPIEQRIQQLATMAGRFVERARAVSPSLESADDQRVEGLNFSRLVLQQQPEPPFSHQLVENLDELSARSRREEVEAMNARIAFRHAPRWARLLGSPIYGSEFDEALFENLPEPNDSADTPRSSS